MQDGPKRRRISVLNTVPRPTREQATDAEVIWMEESQAWYVMSHSAIRFVLRNDERLFRLAHREAAPEASIAELRGGPRSHRLLRTEEHERVHRWYLRWFLPAEVERYTAQNIRPLVEGIIGRFIGDGRAELCTQFCEPLGPRVIASILGLPIAFDDDEFYARAQLCNDAVLAWNKAPEDAATLQEGIAASHALNEMLLPIIRARRAAPQDDLISRLWREGPSVLEGWAEADVLVATREMLLGASETTREALANALHLFLTDDRVRREAVADDGAAFANFIEEALRLRDRTLGGLPRIANEDVDIAGVTIRRDEMVVLSEHGNTDPRHYEHALSVDLARRSPRDHFAFSAGARACIGANLARAQLGTALRMLVDTAPNLTLDATKAAPARSGVGNGFGRSAYGPLHVQF